MTRKQNAFTLVEILIVVIILGILAAIVIPQFTSASDDAQKSRLETDLQALRTQVQLFKAEIGRYPGCKKDGTADAALDFVTEITGNVNNPEGVAKGPWLQEMPKNPFVADADAAKISIVAADPGAAVANFGWVFNGKNGKVFAAHDPAL